MRERDFHFGGPQRPSRPHSARSVRFTEHREGEYGHSNRPGLSDRARDRVWVPSSRKTARNRLQTRPRSASDASERSSAPVKTSTSQRPSSAGFETLFYASVPTRMRPSSGKALRPYRSSRRTEHSFAAQDQEADIFEDTSVVPWDSPSLTEDSASSESSRIFQGTEWTRDELRPRPASARPAFRRSDSEASRPSFQDSFDLPPDYVPHPILDQVEKEVFAKMGYPRNNRGKVNLDDYRKMSYKEWEELQTRQEPVSPIEVFQDNTSAQMFEETGMAPQNLNPTFNRRGWRREVSAILKDAKDPAAPRGRARTVSDDARPPKSSAILQTVPARPVVFRHMVETGRIPKQLNSVAKRLLHDPASSRPGTPHGQHAQHSAASRRPASAQSRASSSSRPSSAQSWTSSALSAGRAHSRTGSRPASATPARRPPGSAPIKAFPADLDASNPSKTVISIQDSTVKFLGFRSELTSQHAALEPPDADTAPGVTATLKSSPLMRGLGEMAVHLLARDCRMVCMRPGTTLCTQGMKGHHAFVLAEGQLSVFHKAGKEAEQAQVGHLHMTGDCVGEMTLLVGVPYPTTVRTVTSCHVVKVPVSGLKAVLHQWPSSSHVLAECLAHQRRLEKLEKHADQPASILIKVLGMKDLKKMRGLAIRPTLQVTLTSEEGTETLSTVLEDVTASFSELPVNQLFEFTVPHSDSRIGISVLHRGKAHGEEAVDIGSASFEFQTALQARTLSARLDLDQGGSVSVLASVRGMYSMPEIQLIEWLDKHASDLPMLLKCGVRSVEDLAEMSHYELLRTMEAHRLGAATMERISKRVQQAKAGGGFLGKDSRALSAQILRHYQLPVVPVAEAKRTPLAPSWENELFVKYLEPAQGPGPSR